MAAIKSRRAHAPCMQASRTGRRRFFSCRFFTLSARCNEGKMACGPFLEDGRLLKRPCCLVGLRPVRMRRHRCGNLTEIGLMVGPEVKACPLLRLFRRGREKARVNDAVFVMAPLRP